MIQYATPTTREAALQFADDFFSAKHSSLWSRSFDIINHQTREEAKEYLVDLLIELGFLEIIETPVDKGQLNHL